MTVVPFGEFGGRRFGEAEPSTVGLDGRRLKAWDAVALGAGGRPARGGAGGCEAGG